MAQRTLAIKYTTEGYQQAIQSMRGVGLAFDEALQNAQNAVQEAAKAAQDATTSGNQTKLAEAQKTQEAAAKRVKTVVSNAYRELRVKSTAEIEDLKKQAISAFKALEASGVASAQDIANAQAALTKRLADLDKQLDQTGEGMQGLGQQTQLTTGFFANFFANLASNAVQNFLGAITNGVNSLKSAVLQAGIATENTKAQLKTIEGSVAAANTAYEKIAKFAKETPFELQQVTAAYVSLANRGIKPTEAELRKIGDLAGSQQKPLQQYVEAILDAMTGENERLKEFGIQAEKSGDKVTFTFKGVKKTVEASGDAIYQALLSFSELEGVLGGMEERAKTTEGQMSNLTDALSQIYVLLFEAIKPALDAVIKTAIGILDPLGQQKDLFAAIKEEAEAFQKFLEQNPQLAKALADQLKNGVQVAAKTVAATAEQILKFLQENPTAIEETIKNLQVLVSVMGEFVKLINSALEGWRKIGELIKIISQEVGGTLSPQKIEEQIRGAGGTDADVKRVLAEIQAEVRKGSIAEQAFDINRTQGIARQFLEAELARLRGQATVNEGSDQGLRNLAKRQEGINSREQAYKPLLDLIARGEGDYNAANRGTAGDTPGGLQAIFGGRSAEQISINELIRAGQKRQVFAVGRYQFIPSTLREAVKREGLSGQEPFNAEVQDRLARYLLNQKRPAIGTFLSGRSNNLREAAQDLAREFASVGLTYPEAGRRVGQSRYAGTAGNAASISPQEAQEALKKVRAALGGAVLPEPPRSQPKPEEDKEKAQKVIEEARSRQDQQSRQREEAARQRLEAAQRRELQQYDLGTANLPPQERGEREQRRAELVREQQFKRESLSIDQTLAQLLEERKRKEQDIKAERETTARDISLEIQLLNERKQQLAESFGVEKQITEALDAQRLAQEAKARATERTRQEQGLELQRLEQEQALKLKEFDAETAQLAQGGEREARAIQREALERELSLQRELLGIEQAITNLQTERQLKLAGELSTGRDITAEINLLELRKTRLEETQILEEQIATSSTVETIAQRSQAYTEQLEAVEELFKGLQSNLEQTDVETKAIEEIADKYKNYTEQLDTARKALLDLIAFKQSLGQDTDPEQEQLDVLIQKYEQLNQLRGQEENLARQQVNLLTQQQNLDQARGLEDLQSQIDLGRADKLRRQGDSFGADAIQKEVAIRQENLRFDQQVLDLSATYGNQPALLDQLIGKARELNEINLDQINGQFQSLGEVIGGVVADGFLQLFDDLISGSKSAGEAFADFGKLILSTIAKMIVQFLILKAVQLFTGFGGGKGGGATTFSGFPSTLGVVAAKDGGLITGPGTGTSDSIPAFLSNGEFVFTAASTRRLGTRLLDDLNQGRVPTLNLSDLPAQSQTNTYNRTATVNVAVTTPNADSFNKSEYQLGKDMAETIRRTMARI
jgi:hypothetical protein